MQLFLGFCNFYRRFIKDYRWVAKPLNELTCKDVAFKFISEYEAVFRQLQELLTIASLLVYYDLMLLTQVETDVSDGVIIGVLS